MSEKTTIEDVGNAFGDAIEGLWRWLLLVAAITIGTCLGITLFVLLVLGLIKDKMRDVNVNPFPTTTTSPTWTTTTPTSRNWPYSP